MHAFAQLLDSLIYTRSRNAKLKLIGDYLRATPDPDRGWAMAALTGDLDLPAVKPAVIRALIEERVDPVLFRMSRDYVGDTAETIALALARRPTTRRPASRCRVSAVVDTLNSLSRSDAPAALAAMLDRLDAEERFALLKMATGALADRRLGAARQDRARAGVRGRCRCGRGGVARASPRPMPTLFDWVEGRGDAADRRRRAGVPPVHARAPARGAARRPRGLCRRMEMGRHPRAARPCRRARPGSTAARATTSPAASPTSRARSRTPGVLDGELMVKGEFQGGAEEGGGAASFNALQQRLGRKVVSAKMLADYPAFVRLYDILFDGAEDLRAAALDRAARSGSRRSPPARSRPFRRQRADRRRGFRRARGDPRRRARRGDRGRDAQAPRFAITSPGAAPACGTNGSAIRSPPIA